MKQREPAGLVIFLVSLGFLGMLVVVLQSAGWPPLPDWEEGLLPVLVATVTDALDRVSGSNAKDEVLSDGPEAVEFTFIALTDMASWIDDATDLRWGLAFSRQNITRVQERDGKSYNQPATSLEDLDRYLVANGIRTGEEVHLQIEPGRYDWLIVMDHDNNGTCDSYLGTIEQDIKMNEVRFAPAEKVVVVVGEDTIPRLTRSTGD